VLLLVANVVFILLLVITLSCLGSLAFSFNFSKPLDFFNFDLFLKGVIYLGYLDK
jgi:hypothetical protein